MLSLFRKSRFTPELYATYNSIVAQSRTPVFYAEWQVPDTVTGRFDMICLHIILVFRRLKKSEKSESKFAQNLFDLFFTDMDRNLREAGTGDISVPKRIKAMGELFYGLLEKLNAALANGDEDEVEKIIKRNILDENSESVSAQKLAQYVMALDAEMDGVDVSDIVNGNLTYTLLQTSGDQ